MITIQEVKHEGLYIRTYTPDAKTHKKHALLFLHGYPGSQKNYDLAEHLALKGFECFVMHYRGSWQSDGQYSLLSIYKDVDAVLKYIAGCGFKEADISLIGSSWGGFVSLEVLSRHPSLNKCILLAPFINISHDEKRLRQGVDFLYSVTKPSIKNYEKEQIYADLKVIQQDYNPIDRVDKIDGSKILIIHGTKDTICPIAGSIALKSQFRGPARLIQLEEQDHFLHTRELIYEFSYMFLKQ